MSDLKSSAFNSMLDQPAPGFWCVSSWDNEPVTMNLVRVGHKLHLPATPSAIQELRQLTVEAGEEIERFYSLHDGGILFAEDRGEECGFEFYSVSAFASELAGLKEFFDPEDEWPEYWWDVVAFAGPYMSADRFGLRVKGPDAGRVYFLQHDDFREDPIADSYDSFLALIAEDPAKLMFECGCYTRYARGGIPIVFVPDCNSAGVSPDKLPDWWE